MRVANIDLDGVLCRWTDGAYKIHGKPPGQPDTWDFHKAWGLSTPDLFAPMDRAFAAGLGVWEDGMDLLMRLRTIQTTHTLHIMTSPWQTPGCTEGKRDWIAKHTPFDPWKDVTMCGSKHVHAGPGKLLIDDSDDNIHKWCGAGGAGWLVPRPWNALRHRCNADGLFDVDREIGDLLKLMRSVR